MDINQLGKQAVAAPTTERASPSSGANLPGTTRAAPAQAAAATSAPPPADDVRKAASQVNEALQRTASSDLQFSVEGDNKEVVVRVVDSQTKEVIRQIPSEQMVAISKAMDNLSGLLVQQKA